MIQDDAAESNLRSIIDRSRRAKDKIADLTKSISSLRCELHRLVNPLVLTQVARSRSATSVGSSIMRPRDALFKVMDDLLDRVFGECTATEFKPGWIEELTLCVCGVRASARVCALWRPH